MKRFYQIGISLNCFYSVYLLFFENWHKSCLCLFSNYKTNICSRPAVLVKDLTESLHGHGRPRALVRKNFNLGVDFPLHIWYIIDKEREVNKMIILSIMAILGIAILSWWYVTLSIYQEINISYIIRIIISICYIILSVIIMIFT